MGKLKILLLITAIAAFLAAVAMAIWHINGPRVVGRAVSPDGVEMCVVQRCNWGGEPFTTSFFCRQPGSNWAWFYFDHQDWYWGYSQASLDTNAKVAIFYRGTNEAIKFDWGREIYWRGNRVWATGAQSYLPAGQAPF